MVLDLGVRHYFPFFTNPLIVSGPIDGTRINIVDACAISMHLR